jgi:hypothetical protein
MAAVFVHASAAQTAQGNIRPKASQRPGQIASVQIAAWLARTYKDVHARFHLLLIPGRFGPGLWSLAHPVRFSISATVSRKSKWPSHQDGHFAKSGRQDLNLRPPEPHSGALIQAELRPANRTSLADRNPQALPPGLPAHLSIYALPLPFQTNPVNPRPPKTGNRGKLSSVENSFAQARHTQQVCFSPPR